MKSEYPVLEMLGYDDPEDLDCANEETAVNEICDLDFDGDVYALAKRLQEERDSNVRSELFHFMDYCEEVDKVWANEFRLWIDRYLNE